MSDDTTAEPTGTDFPPLEETDDRVRTDETNPLYTRPGYNYNDWLKEGGDQNETEYTLSSEGAEYWMLLRLRIDFVPEQDNDAMESARAARILEEAKRRYAGPTEYPHDYVVHSATASGITYRVYYQHLYSIPIEKAVQLYVNSIEVDALKMEFMSTTVDRIIELLNTEYKDLLPDALELERLWKIEQAVGADEKTLEWLNRIPNMRAPSDTEELAKRVLNRVLGRAAPNSVNPENVIGLCRQNMDTMRRYNYNTLERGRMMEDAAHGFDKAIEDGYGVQAHFLIQKARDGGESTLIAWSALRSYIEKHPEEQLQKITPETKKILNANYRKAKEARPDSDRWKWRTENRPIRGNLNDVTLATMKDVRPQGKGMYVPMGPFTQLEKVSYQSQIDGYVLANLDAVKKKAATGDIIEAIATSTRMQKGVAPLDDEDVDLCATIGAFTDECRKKGMVPRITAAQLIRDLYGLPDGSKVSDDMIKKLDARMFRLSGMRIQLYNSTLNSESLDELEDMGIVLEKGMAHLVYDDEVRLNKCGKNTDGCPIYVPVLTYTFDTGHLAPIYGITEVYGMRVWLDSSLKDTSPIPRNQLTPAAKRMFDDLKLNREGKTYAKTPELYLDPTSNAELKRWMRRTIIRMIRIGQNPVLLNLEDAYRGIKNEEPPMKSERRNSNKWKDFKHNVYRQLTFFIQRGFITSFDIPQKGGVQIRVHYPLETAKLCRGSVDDGTVPSIEQ